MEHYCDEKQLRKNMIEAWEKAEMEEKEEYNGWTYAACGHCQGKEWDIGILHIFQNEDIVHLTCRECGSSVYINSLKNLEKLQKDFLELI